MICSKIQRNNKFQLMSSSWWVSDRISARFVHSSSPDESIVSFRIERTKGKMYEISSYEQHQIGATNKILEQIILKVIQFCMTKMVMSNMCCYNDQSLMGTSVNMLYIYINRYISSVVLHNSKNNYSICWQLSKITTTLKLHQIEADRKVLFDEMMQNCDTDSNISRQQMLFFDSSWLMTRFMNIMSLLQQLFWS